ncbi:PKD domain-containing protein [Mucilaginibacter sp. UYCu711]|uniref:PKD domain-containing protein n=1 Tax=Mucilaginibacter sp. UYCu711 TaxID=3156339 RepID=UPI003D22A982
MKTQTLLPMKKLFKPIAMFFCVAALVSCAKNEVPVAVDVTPINPISDYTITPDPTDAFTFKFTSLAKDYTIQEWRFGDDTLKTEEDPIHTYLEPGTYLVDLKTVSKTGDISHKNINITIVPDSVVQLSTEKTGEPYQLKFSAKVKAKVKSVLWTFNAVDPVTSTTITTTSTELTPLQSFALGSFNNFTVKVTTDKGSVVTVGKSVTTEGIATDITLSNIRFTSTNENLDQGPNEGSLKLIDGNPATKFGYYKEFEVPETATLQFAAPVAVKLYAIQNGNDSESERDPKEWYVEGSNDNEIWTVLDHQTLTIGFADYLKSIGQTETRYNRLFYYPLANPQPFTYYRWRIISTFAGAFQIEEFKLFK